MAIQMSFAGRAEGASRQGLCVWHLMALVAFVAIAVFDIKANRVSDPNLMALACVGYAGYGLLGWLAWQAARPYQRRLRPGPLVVYLVGMGLLFLLANVAFLVVERFYLLGHW